MRKNADTHKTSRNLQLAGTGGFALGLAGNILGSTTVGDLFLLGGTILTGVGAMYRYNENIRSGMSNKAALALATSDLSKTCLRLGLAAAVSFALVACAPGIVSIISAHAALSVVSAVFSKTALGLAAGAISMGIWSGAAATINAVFRRDGGTRAEINAIAKRQAEIQRQTDSPKP